MKQFGSLWKRDYSLSPRGTATPKSALGAIVTNDRNDLSRVTKCSSTNYKDASREDPLCRGASAMHFNQNSPKTEKFGAPVSEYDDVFGGPPKYAFSRPSPVFDDTCQMPSRSSPGWKDSDFPVFGTPAPVDGAFVAVSVKASIPDDLNERRKLNSSRLQNNLFAIGIRSRVSSRSNSCVQSPLRSASSSSKDCMHDEFLTASVRLRTDCNEDAQSFRETGKVGVMSDTKSLEKDSRRDFLGSYENVATVSSGISSEQIFTRNCGRAIPVNSEQNLSKSKDKPNIDPSSPLVQHKYGSTATYSSEDFNECLLDEVNTVSMKKVPRVSPAPLYPVSSPRLKNQKSFFRRKLGLEPTEELSIHANSTAKEGILSPSSNFQHSSPAGSGSFARAISQEKSQKQVPGERVFVTSCTHLEVLDRNVVKNRAGKQTNKDYEVFASAIAAIKNTESKLKIFNLARQKEEQKLVAREDKVSEKQAESREDSCSNKETEDAVAKMESSKVQETAESFRKFRSQIKEKQETETRFSHEVLEREEIEALEAVERERKQREKERQKERERQETRASLEIIILEAEEQAAAETWEEFKCVAAQQLKSRSKSIADLSTGGNLVAGAVATAGEVAVEKAEIETLQKLVQNIAVARITCVDSEETTKQIQVEPRDQQPRNQPDIMKTSLKSDLMAKLGEGIIPVCDAEHASVEEVADDWLSTPNIEKVEEDAPEEKIASTERTLNHVVRALNERNQHNFEVQQGQAEKHTLADLLDGDIKRWATGKEGNLRALLSTLQYVLWPECAWQPVYLTDIIGPTSVKKIYRKAMLIVHPDKIQQKGASLQQKYIAETVFFLLKDAWNRFNSDEIL